MFQEQALKEAEELAIYQSLRDNTLSPYLSGYQKNVAGGLAHVIHVQQAMMGVLNDLQDADALREDLDNALVKDLDKIRKNTGKRERNITVWNKHISSI